MAAPFKKISGSKVEFNITIESKDLQSAQKKIVDDYRKHVSVPGFRKGQAPDKMVVARVGLETISQESMNQALNKVYQGFLQEHKIDVISQPELDFSKKEEMPMTVGIKVEVYPDVAIGDYKKIKMKQPKVEIKDAEVDDVIETVLAQMQSGTKVDRKAKDKDLIEADFEGKNEKGEVLPSTKLEKTKFRIGLGHYLSDLEKAFVGMKAGESKDKVPVKFPKDYHSADFAGKTIHFNIHLYEVNEIKASEITEEQIESVMGKKQKPEDFRKEVKENIENNKKKEAQQAETDSYTKEIGKITKGDLPESWIKKEIHMQFQRMAQNPQYQQDPAAFLKSLGKDEEALKKEFEVQGEENLRIFLGLKEVITQEKIELDKDELLRAAEQAKNGKDEENIEFERICLNIKIDKYLSSLFA